MTIIKKDIKMIRYSNTPDKTANAITNNFTSSAKTTRDPLDLNDEGVPNENKIELNDMFANDADGTD